MTTDPALLSITGSMPVAYLDETTASENTRINDSQVSRFASRYRQQMYPERRLPHDDLGVLGTHHRGVALAFAIEDDHPNPFPRATMLHSIAEFITSLDAVT